MSNILVTVEPDLPHVGDVGTIYRAKLTGIEPPYPDPLLADIVQLIFRMADGTLTKDAEIAEVHTPVRGWELSYQVQGDDGFGSPAGLFHLSAGAIQIQGYLRWSGTGSPSAEEFQYHSDIATTDDTGRTLQVLSNII